MSAIEDKRLQLGTAAVFSPTEAAHLLPGNADRNLRWLREEGLVTTRGPRPMVVWGRVLQHLEAQEPVQRRSNMPREAL